MSLRSELKPMLRLAGPVVVAELGWMAMGLVDVLMVGPLGPAAIGAVGVGASLHMGFAIFGMGLLLGLDTMVSQAHGRGDAEACRHWLVQGTWLAIIVAVPLMLVCVGVLFVVPQMGFHPDVMPLARGYLSVVIWSTGPLLLYTAFRRYLQGMHVVTPLMFALVSANVLNVVGNWVFVYGRFGMPVLGVSGTALATVMSRTWMMLVLLVAIALHDRWRRGGLARLSWRPQVVRLRQLIGLGLPASLQVTLEVGVFATATVLAGRLDPISSASHQIALNIASTAFMIPLGLSSAGAVRVGSRLGEGRIDGARRAGWTALAVGLTVMAGTGLLFFLIPGALIGLFTHDPAVLALGGSLLFVAAVFQLFDGVQSVATGILRGLGETRAPMLTNLIGHWVIGLPLGYALCFAWGLGVIGLWWGLSAGLIVCGVVLVWVWRIQIGRRLHRPRATEV